MPRPKPAQPKTSPYQKLYGKPLTAEQVSEMNFNLVRFVETLIAMDKQHKKSLKNQPKKEK